VTRISASAPGIEAETLDPESLTDVATRTDELRQLARVSQHTAYEVQAREQRPRSQVEPLRIEIDEAKKVRQVGEITETEYFRGLSEPARRLREKKGGA
jgi:DNA repair ATPase RecN